MPVSETVQTFQAHAIGKIHLTRFLFFLVTLDQTEINGNHWITNGIVSHTHRIQDGCSKTS